MRCPVQKRGHLWTQPTDFFLQSSCCEVLLLICSFAWRSHRKKKEEEGRLQIEEEKRTNERTAQESVIWPTSGNWKQKRNERRWMVAMTE